MLHMQSGDMTRQIIVDRKVLQEFQIYEKLKGMSSPGSGFENGVRQVDIANKLDIPQSTVRKYLRKFVRENKVSVNVVSSRCSFYTPLDEFRQNHQS